MEFDIVMTTDKDDLNNLNTVIVQIIVLTMIKSIKWIIIHNDIHDAPQAAACIIACIHPEIHHFFGNVVMYKT